jgi:hypothetical protein
MKQTMIGSFRSGPDTEYRRDEVCAYNGTHGSSWAVWRLGVPPGGDGLPRVWMFSGKAFVAGRRPSRRDVVAGFDSAPPCALPIVNDEAGR